MESDCRTLDRALLELEEIAPNAPLLALGQTVLWDEPMKAGLPLAIARLGLNRKLVAGVHDTDYFAKLPSGRREKGAFAAFGHNATTTKDLWSAAAEFSTLFGSESVVRRSVFLSAGSKLESVTQSRPGILDEMSEAFGWRGVVSLDEDPPVTNEVRLESVFQPLQKTLHWAIEETVSRLSGESQNAARKKVDELWTIICDAYADFDQMPLTEFYRAILPKIYEFVAGQLVEIEATVTSELLKFNTSTAHLPRFGLVGLFLDPESRSKAGRAYDAAVAGSEIYPLDRFGTGATPFDLVIPGFGRGTLRIGRRGIVIMSREPQFISLKHPVTTPFELAEVIEKKFGQDCVLIGKAVSLIGMLSTEFVFVFHEGASGYTQISQKFHGNLVSERLGLKWNPILRIRYNTWDTIGADCTWLGLPAPLQAAFGAEELCSPSFASRWRKVGEEQQELLSVLGTLRRPIELIRFLDQHLGGGWSSVADEYEELHAQVQNSMSEIDQLTAKRRGIYAELRQLRSARVDAERAKGEHFRSRIFEKVPNEDDLAERERHIANVEGVVHSIQEKRREIKVILKQQSEIAQSQAMMDVHTRRRNIELEAELKRMKLIRNAYVSSVGLKRAGARPSAWWFPLVSPSGKWFAETWNSADCWFEHLSELAPIDSPVEVS